MNRSADRLPVGHRTLGAVNLRLRTEHADRHFSSEVLRVYVAAHNICLLIFFKLIRETIGRSSYRISVL